MLPTAFSYGCMAARYPVAGSAYIYVSRGLHPQLGFLAGWAMCLDYFVLPVANVIYCAATMHRVAPVLPYPAWALLFASLCTFLNLRGIRTGVRSNQLMLAIMTTILALVIALSVKYVVTTDGAASLVSAMPFFNPQEFHIGTIASATSFAALTYIGFDAVTTLAEEVENPRRNIARATVLVCLITGLGSILVIYLAQLVWPLYQDFKSIDTAFLDVSDRIGGGGLFAAMVIVLILAQFGCAFTSQASAARLLFGMGKATVLPWRVVTHLNPRSLQPSYNVCFVGIVAFTGALLLDFQRAGELLNFGAFLSFMGVNLAALRSAVAQRERARASRVFQGVVASVGFISCLAIWLNLPAAARQVGFVWMGLGLLYQAIKTRGFRISIEFTSDKSAAPTSLP